MASYPHAVQKRIVRNFGGRRPSTRAVVLHVDAGGAASLQGWFNNPSAQASSHFYVKYDGTVEQYLDTDVIAWTQRDGNASCIGIETQGKGEGEWTAAQAAAIVNLVRWLCDLYGLPKVDMASSKSGARGIGMHRYGIDPWRVAGGQVWGPRGKVCPGNDRVRQFPAAVASVANGTAVPVSNPAGGSDSEAQNIARMNAGYSIAWIRSIQEKLNRLGASLDTDGVRGPKTIAAVRDFQAKHGLVVDGLPGAATNAKLDAVLAPAATTYRDITGIQRAVRAAADNVNGPDTRKRVDAVRKASTWGGRQHPYGVKYTQAVVGTKADGVWGKNSNTAHDATVRAIQAAVGAGVDGIWGTETDTKVNAALAGARTV